MAQQAAQLEDSFVRDQKEVERGRLGGIARAMTLLAENRVVIAKAARATPGVNAAPARKAARKPPQAFIARFAGRVVGVSSSKTATGAKANA